MMQPDRRTLGWLVANCAGLILYLYLASQTWITPIDGVLAHAAGDPFVYMLCVFPVLATFTLSNFAWLIVILKNKQNRLCLTKIWILTAAIWVVANRIDAHNQ